MPNKKPAEVVLADTPEDELDYDIAEPRAEAMIHSLRNTCENKLYERAKRVALTILNEYRFLQREQFDEAILIAARVCPGINTETLRHDLETIFRNYVL